MPTFIINRLQIHADAYRTVVGTHLTWMNLGGFDFGLQTLGNQKIINTPADVASPGIGKMAPPGVIAVALLKHPERIDETGIQPVVETVAFFGGEAFFSDIGLG